MRIAGGECRGETGAALVAVVLLTLALFALGHGLLVLSLGELAAARAGVRHLEARTAAESAVRTVLASPGEAWMDSVARWDARPVATLALGRSEGAGTLRRLTEEAWLVEGAGRTGVALHRTARLAWALDPLARVMSLGGVVTIGVGSPLTLAGAIDAGRPTAVEAPLAAADCAPWTPALEAHYLADPLAEVATLDATDTLPRLGLLDFTTLLAQVDVTVSGVGVPAPVELLGACATVEPWNWGDAERPWRPCGPHLALRGAAADLYVNGGVGQGLLVVDGDVTLAGGARFFGLVIASGELRLDAGAVLEGMALAAGGVHLAPDTRVKGAACWAARALAAQRATLGRLRPIPGVGAIGPL